jgi:predicted transposase YdaD
MAKPFDATLNSLIDLRADDWATFLADWVGIPRGPSSAVDTDLSITVQADKVFRIDGPDPALVHLEMESSSALGIPADLMRYNVLLSHQLGLPVHSVLMLLRPRANASDQTGTYRVVGSGRLILEFHYTVIRVWEEPAERFLAGGLGLAPLALLTNEADANLPAVFTRIEQELRTTGMPSKVAEELLTATFVLGGLRYNEARLTELYRSVNMTLEDSTTYQWIVRKGLQEGIQKGLQQGLQQGRSTEAQSLLLRQGTKRFGVEPAVEPRLRAVTDIERLERMADRIFDATSWDDLLATP